MAVPLATLAAAAGANLPEESGHITIQDLSEDSRTIKEGGLFVARSGSTTDGHRFVAEAVRRGAVAVLAERPVSVEVPQLLTTRIDTVMGAVAGAFWGRPAADLTMIGVTGTNGKTTTTHLLAHILNLAGTRAAVIGTLTDRLTTPPPIELHRRLAELRSRGYRAVVMEVSSHGLDQERVGSLRFAAGLFTNLDRDHLDYHGTMDRYFAAKAKLFEPDRTAVGIINVDCDWGRRLAMASPRLRTWSLADASWEQPHRFGTYFVWHGLPVDLQIAGRFNMSNAIGAATAAFHLGIDPATIVAALSTASAPGGRMELISAPGFSVVVDCAHTPAALQHVLGALRSNEGRLIVVFGCGGRRDRTKRPAMGALVAAGADLAILTADNPRGEALHQIFDDVLAGMSLAPPLVEPDRGAAIRLAISQARPGDTVLIAGKGNQTIQDLGNRVEAFDDRVHARRAVAQWAAATPARA